MEAPAIRILQPHDQEALETFLRPRVESSMFLIGNLRAAGLHDTGRPYEGTYAAAFDGGAIVAVVAHYWNGNLILQTPVYVVELLRAAVAASARSIKGLLGPDDQVSVAKAGLRIDAAQIQLDDTERLYTLAL